MFLTTPQSSCSFLFFNRGQNRHPEPAGRGVQNAEGLGPVVLPEVVQQPPEEVEQLRQAPHVAEGLHRQSLRGQRPIRDHGLPHEEQRHRFRGTRQLVEG